MGDIRTCKHDDDCANTQKATDLRARWQAPQLSVWPLGITASGGAGVDDGGGDQMNLTS